MKIAARPGNFGEPPKPKLEFLRLRSLPPKVKEADIREVAKYAPGDQVVWDSKQFPGLAGLRSAEVREVDFANPNYAPLPRSNEPEPIYLIKLDSNPTTYARTSPRWVRETQIHPRPCGVQWDAWQKARLKWDHVWDQDKEFELLAEKQTEAHVKRTPGERSISTMVDQSTLWPWTEKVAGTILGIRPPTFSFCKLRSISDPKVGRP